MECVAPVRAGLGFCAACRIPGKAPFCGRSRRNASGEADSLHAGASLKRKSAWRDGKSQLQKSAGFYAAYPAMTEHRSPVHNASGARFREVKRRMEKAL